ncbi:MAG TPA: exodeoxyribonuclease V subunit gamma, partial [Solirubrobacteraceae bacterium]|nr:exodeoxyribonuclease V subunit gamma [Solirubrobacteraceae bacterium]
LLTVVEANLEQDWLSPLAVHLRSRLERRFASVQRIAALYGRYERERPSLIQAWASGAGEHWQAQLWRALRAHVGVESPAQRLAAAAAALRERPELLELPERLFLFGPTRLPTAHVEVLHAIAARRELHLMLLHPSPALWEHGPQPNRLLSSWGREIAELRQVLGAIVSDRHHPGDFAAPTTLLVRIQADIRAGVQPPGLPLPGQQDARMVLADADQSVAIHSCHGRARQVEVLREAILHRLAADPTLEPRDVIVMCPDVETFAPLIEASFAGGELPVRLADRALRRTNPVLSLLARLLELPGSRVTASAVLDLIDTEPLRRRFGLDDDDLAKIRTWVAEAAVHWGLNGPARVPFRLREEIEAGTWALGLRRLLLGAALDGEAQGLYGGVLALADVQSDDISLAGRFAELLERLHDALDQLSGRQTIGSWTAAISRAADALSATSERDSWQRHELDLLLADILGDAAAGAGGGAAAGAGGDAAASAGADAAASADAGLVAGADPGSAGDGGPVLSLAELRALIGDRLAGRPTRANFRTGHLTVCTLMPMRSVPHRVICLLGLDDGAFPRQPRRDGDDLLRDDPQPGDRDPRAEDRQLLLDALMAAQDAVIITYSGHDERTNAYRPPCVPVGELLDMIDATARVDDSCHVAGPGQQRRETSRQWLPARECVRVEHPLQPFDPDNFRAPQPWSFDPVALAGARAFAGGRQEAPPFLPAPLAPAEEHEALALSDLLAFVQNPVRAFLRQRLELSLFGRDDDVDDALPVELDQLGKWGVGQRLLDGVLSGAPGAESRAAEEARGTLPPGRLGAAVLAEVAPAVNALSRVALGYIGSHEPRSFETNLVLRDGTRLTGTVAGVRGDTLLSVSYSRLNAQHRIAAWMRLLALSAAHPQIPFQAVTVARNPDSWGGKVTTVRLRQLGATPQERHNFAQQQLLALADLRRRGMREPLPLPTRTACAYAEARLRRRAPVEEALKAAEKQWLSTRDFKRGVDINREDRADEHLLAFGGRLPLADLARIPPASDEQGDGWPADEPGRFGRYALALWRALLEHESWDEDR